MVELKETLKGKPFAVPIYGEYNIASVGQNKNELLYRGYSINDLIDNGCSYEEIVYLILRKRLPNTKQLRDYKKKLNGYKLNKYPKLIKLLISNELFTRNDDYIDVLKIAIAYLGVIKIKNKDRNEEKENMEYLLDKMDEIISLIPIILLTYHHKMYIDKKMDINNRYCFAKRFLDINNIDNKMIITSKMIECMNNMMILYTEHGITTSAFTARIVTSARSDLYSSICAALCSAKGSLHCGANKKALELIMNYNKKILLLKIKNKEIIQGFGHRSYMRKDLRIDPRNIFVKTMAKSLSMNKYNPNKIFARKDLYQNAVEIEQIMMNKKNLFANIDFFGPIVHYQLGINPLLLTSMICINLCVGWMANIIQQKSNKYNRLIRPISVYNGPIKKQFIPLKSRL